MPPPAEAVLLDLYDTLIYCPRQAVSHAVAAYFDTDPDRLDRAYQGTRYERYGGVFGGARADLMAVLDHAEVGFDDESLAGALQVQSVEVTQSTKLYGDTLEGLRRFRELGLATQIISNAAELSRPLVDHLGIAELVDDVILSADVQATKPGRTIFEVGLERLGVSAEAAWFIDDKIRYLEGAAVVGIRPMQIRRPETADPDAVWTGGPVVFSLLEAIDRIADLG